jgi:ABC-type molybdate transport system substrate-binding protein
METRLRLLLTIVISVVVSLAPMLHFHDDPSYAAERTVVRVAAVADTKFAFDEIVDAFRRQQPEIEVRVTYGTALLSRWGAERSRECRPPWLEVLAALPACEGMIN